MNDQARNRSFETVKHSAQQNPNSMLLKCTFSKDIAFLTANNQHSRQRSFKLFWQLKTTAQTRNFMKPATKQWVA